MSDHASPETVTVFRSADENAQEEASAILDMLADAGLNAMLVTDDYPGVPKGAVEIRVPAEEEVTALDVIDAQSADEPGGSPSHGYDLVEMYRGMGTTGEVEALSIRAVLDANHIPNVLIGSMQMPNLPFRVMVPQVFTDAANDALNEAAAAGPAGADEAEAASESSPAS